MFKPIMCLLILVCIHMPVDSSAQSVKKISSASFAPFEGGQIGSHNGCYINRPPEASEPDGSLYAGVELPIGSTITGITGHFLDWTQDWHVKPLLQLRQHQGGGSPVVLAAAQNPDALNGPVFYEQDADVDPDYVVQENDFFDLLFIAGDVIVNSYYICGVEIHYIPAE